MACSGIYFKDHDWVAKNVTDLFPEKNISFPEDDDLTEIDDGDFFANLYTDTQARLNVLSMASVILYCPIFISIRTKDHLISALQSKPDRYIRYQAVFVALSKSLNALVMFYHFVRRFYGFHGIQGKRLAAEDEIELLFQSISNFGATPFIIQITYLSCNKRNVQAMLSMICPGRCSCRNPRRSTLVAPVMLMDGETTVYAIPNN